tara:strand:- start:3183 stop:3359 length:177 start_codon:yes stop_codon:yes gene_type:complete
MPSNSATLIVEYPFIFIALPKGYLIAIFTYALSIAFQVMAVVLGFPIDLVKIRKLSCY